MDDWPLKGSVRAPVEAGEVSAGGMRGQRLNRPELASVRVS